MIRNVRLLVLICVAAITAVLGLQCYWIIQYYKVTAFNFEREINLAFEDAVKKEFALRCDTIESIVVERLMDTSEFHISSSIKSSGETVFTVSDAKNRKDRDMGSFSNKQLKGPMDMNDSLSRLKVARVYASGLRTEDLEKHVIFYRTQNLGEFLVKQVEKYDFDTARLRPVLAEFLHQRNIKTAYSFDLKAQDSLLNRSNTFSVLGKQVPIATKAFPTYKWHNDQEKYVVAQFANPMQYIFSRMGWVFLGSLGLMALVACAIFLLFKALWREKRLSLIKNDFISNITHELKTPIATVSAAVEALLDFNALADEDKAKRYLMHSRNELERLSGLVNKVLDISIYEKGQLESVSQEFSVREEVQHILSSFTLVASKPVAFTFINETKRDRIVADKSLFYHAVKNIVDNAVKYSGAAVEITVRCSEKNGYFMMAIMDNGHGISTASLPYAFDKFYREPGLGHKVKGQGLGLSYVKSIMDYLKGYVKLESTKGKGTTVYLAWPI